MEETISAIATPQGMGGIGVVRISGKDALRVADAVFSADSGKRLADTPGGRFLHGKLVDSSGEEIDEVLALVFRAPHSYTGEDVVELQCHGGQYVLRCALALTYSAGARPAERGEFTKRAFLNGRLDLSQAEGVMEVVGARTKGALTMANGHLTGRFSREIKNLREAILAMLAHIEANIDFPEDEVDDVIAYDLEKNIHAVRKKIAEMERTADAGRVLRGGLPTAIIGKPNVGKSSLMNAFLREDRAIVTDIPGTTRDTIEEVADVGGVPLCIVDTAGIRAEADTVERLGIERSREYAKKASLVLMLFDGSRPLDAEDEEILTIAKEREGSAMILLTKVDLPPKTTAATLSECAGGLPVHAISTETGEGLEDLTAAIRGWVYRDVSEGAEGTFVATEREARTLQAADKHLEAAQGSLAGAVGMDFVSIDLRAAWEELGKLTGEALGTELLDEIFSKFCIGK